MYQECFKSLNIWARKNKNYTRSEKKAANLMKKNKGKVQLWRNKTRKFNVESE